jgi:zinc-binding in reverse transcriptase
MRDLTTLNTYYNASVHHQQDGTPNWRWSAMFTVQSVYKMYNNPGIIQIELSCLWDLKAPNKIKVFLWLLLQDRLNIIDNLQKKGLVGQSKLRSLHIRQNRDDIAPFQ